MDFTNLISNISKADSLLANKAKQSINIYVTIRNWLLGYYIQEYELKGSDRAKYGEKLLESLAAELQKNKVSSSSKGNLKVYRQFYQSYKTIGQTLSGQLQTFQLAQLENNLQINCTASEQLEDIAKNYSNNLISPENLINNLSFSHFVELMKIEEDLKRNFYELECIKGSWSIRELKRQIYSLYFERTALSKDKKKLVEYVRQSTKPDSITIKDTIRDPYIFEFLGFKSQEVMYESDIQKALLDKLQDFLLELGKGVCFEARNKRILIGNNYYFIDLVLYHRVLKCSILVELKLNAFNHENIGQLKTYLNYYKKHEMNSGDNPPIGILLCAEKDHALVEYALGDEQTERLFISKYQLALPSKKEIKEFIEKELKE